MRAPVCVCCLIRAAHVWRPGDSPQELALSLYCGGSEKAAQFFRPMQKECSYSLGFPSPGLVFVKTGFHGITQSSLELSILLLENPGCWVTDV